MTLAGGGFTSWIANPQVLLGIVGIGVVLAVIGLIGKGLESLSDRVRWQPWARKRGYASGHPIRTSGWGELFGATVSGPRRFTGTVRGRPMAVLTYERYGYSRDPDDGVLTVRLIVCAVQLPAAPGDARLTRTLLSPVAPEPGDTPPATGNEVFDRIWRLSTDSVAMRNALQSPPMVEYVLKGKAASVRIVGDQLIVIARAQRETPRRMDTVVEFTGGLLDRLPALQPGRPS